MKKLITFEATTEERDLLDRAAKLAKLKRGTWVRSEILKLAEATLKEAGQ